MSQYVREPAVCRPHSRVAPAEAAQIHRMQTKQEEKAELEAILEQVRHIPRHGLDLLLTFARLLRYVIGAVDAATHAYIGIVNSVEGKDKPHMLMMISHLTLIMGTLHKSLF